MSAFSDQKILKRAKEVLSMEASMVAVQAKRLTSDFVKAVRIVADCTGHVVVVGVGKSGLIGRKITATLASTGTPATFVHPAEGMHGDLGMITRRDIILALSFSGETEELKRLLPSLRALQVPVIAMTGRERSLLAQTADVALTVSVQREACPYNITPTTSTTAMLAMGDALAMCVMQIKNFKAEDFARLHPGGSLGKQLLWTIADVMHRGKENPVIHERANVREALMVMTKTRTGATSVIDRRGRIVGYFTDGDFRRLAQKDPQLLTRTIASVMTKKPHVLTPATRLTEALRLLKQYRCDNMPVVDDKQRPIGLLDERDLLSEGLI